MSYRVIAYYERETEHAPAHLLAPLAKALKVTADELMGIKDIKPQLDPENVALWRRLKKAEILPKADQKALLQYLDALVRKNESVKQ